MGTNFFSAIIHMVHFNFSLHPASLTSQLCIDSFSPSNICSLYIYIYIYINVHVCRIFNSSENFQKSMIFQTRGLVLLKPEDISRLTHLTYSLGHLYQNFFHLYQGARISSTDSYKTKKSKLTSQF